MSLNSHLFIHLSVSACNPICLNGGTINEESCQCDCPDYYNGDNCESEPTVHMRQIDSFANDIVYCRWIFCAFASRKLARQPLFAKCPVWQGADMQKYHLLH